MIPSLHSNGTTAEPTANLSYPVGEFRLFRISPMDPDSMRYIDRLVIRALQFLVKYEAATDPQWLVDLIYGNLKQRNNFVFILVAVDQNDNIVGHSISYVEQYQKLIVACVLQAERDGVAEFYSSDLWNTAEQLTNEWARSLGIGKYLAYVLPGARPRLYRMRGWKEFRVMMTKEIEGGS